MLAVEPKNQIAYEFDERPEAGASSEVACLRLSLEAPGPPADAIQCMLDPGSLDDPALHTLVSAAHEIAARLGSRIECSPASEGVEVALHLPLLPDA